MDDRLLQNPAYRPTRLPTSRVVFIRSPGLSTTAGRAELSRKSHNFPGSLNTPGGIVKV